eukprot:scpid47904/ scgid34846/ 
MSSAAEPFSRAAKKNLKRRAKKRQAEGGEEAPDALKANGVPTATTAANGSSAQLVNGQNAADAPKQGNAASTSNVDTMRTRLKHLQRKVKEIYKLEEAKAKGTRLDATQMMKLKSKNTMLNEIYDIEVELNKIAARDAQAKNVTSTAAAGSDHTTTATATSAESSVSVNGHATVEPVVTSHTNSNHQHFHQQQPHNNNNGLVLGAASTAPSAVVSTTASTMSHVIPSPQVALNAAAGFPMLPPQPVGNPLLPLPANMPYFLPNMMMPPPPAPNMMGYFPPVRPFPPVPMGAPMPVPDSAAMPTQAMGTGDMRPVSSQPSVPAAMVPAQQANAAAAAAAAVSQQAFAAPPAMGMYQQVPPPAAPARRSATKIVIRDPNTGNDITEKILGKRTMPLSPDNSDVGCPLNGGYPPLVCSSSDASNGSTGVGAQSNATSPATATAAGAGLAGSSGNLAEQVALLGISGASTPSSPSSPQNVAPLGAWSTGPGPAAYASAEPPTHVSSGPVVA